MPINLIKIKNTLVLQLVTKMLRFPIYYYVFHLLILTEHLEQNIGKHKRENTMCHKINHFIKYVIEYVKYYEIT